MFEKLKFWKKSESTIPSFGKDDFGAGFEKDSAAGLGGTGELGDWPKPETRTEHKYPTREPDYDVGPPPELQPTNLKHKEIYPSSGGDLMAKDMELLSVKIDSIKVSIETLNQRMANIERMMLEKKKGW